MILGALDVSEPLRASRCSVTTHKMLDALFSIAKTALSFIPGVFRERSAKHQLREMLYREISWNLTTLDEVLRHAREENLDIRRVSGLLDYRLKKERYEAALKEPLYHRLPEAPEIDLLYKDLDILRTNISGFADPLKLIQQRLYWFGPTFISKPFKRRIMLRVGSKFVKTSMYIPDVPIKWPLKLGPLRRIRDKFLGYY